MGFDSLGFPLSGSFFHVGQDFELEILKNTKTLLLFSVFLIIFCHTLSLFQCAKIMRKPL